MTRRSEQRLTAQDMASIYKISTATVRAKVRSGQWPGERIGRLYRFSPDQQDDIAQIVAGNKPEEYDPKRIAAALRKLSA